VVVAACLIFLGSIVSPPSLMDDVDAVYATVARSMIESGDWVTARLNGVLYVDKAPMQVWVMAVSFAVFGVSDWAARIPMALAAVALCWLTFRFGRWAEAQEGWMSRWRRWYSATSTGSPTSLSTATHRGKQCWRRCAAKC
jgi:4-amino-4-deoxy-L-arabinose transferase-like glycosyltransferase